MPPLCKGGKERGDCKKSTPHHKAVRCTSNVPPAGALILTMNSPVPRRQATFKLAHILYNSLYIFFQRKGRGGKYCICRHASFIWSPLLKGRGLLFFKQWSSTCACRSEMSEHKVQGASGDRASEALLCRGFP